MIGQTINNYVLERKLGEGGMGNVYFARHNRIDRVVAIKVLHKNLFTNESIRTRFKNEANALIKLGHPNIVKIYDYVEQEEFACLIMEYMEGYTLDDYINKVTGPLPGAKATHIITGVLDAVQYAHDKNIYHRDIKPGNIMVSQDGRTVRIMDFSIAKFTDSGNFKTTHANAQLGTPFYMSPEQVKGMPYTALSDIYSLGVTLFEMVTGKCPYHEITNLFELQSKIVNEQLPPTGKYYPNVTGRLQDAIIIATQKNPGQRFKNCIEFRNYLLEEEKIIPVITPPPVPVPEKKPPAPKPVQIQKKIKPQPETAMVPALPEGRKKNNTRKYLLLIFPVAIIGAVIIASGGWGKNGTGKTNGDTAIAVLPAENKEIPVDSGPVADPKLIEETKKEDAVTNIPKPEPERVLRDLTGKSLSTGAIFSETDKAYMISPPYFAVNCNCASFKFTNASGDSVFRVTVYYQIVNSAYVYSHNKVTASPRTTPTAQLERKCPPVSLLKNDLLKHQKDLCGFYRPTDEIRNPDCKFSDDGDECTVNLILRTKDLVEYKVTIDYKNNFAANGKITSYELISIPVCKLLTPDIPAVVQTVQPKLPSRETVLKDFRDHFSGNAIASDINYTDKSGLSGEKTDMKATYEGKSKSRVSFVISFKYNGIPLISKIVYYDNGSPNYIYNTINPMQ